MAKILTFDGMSGAGKGTQIGKLRDELEREGLRTYVFAEPSEKGRAEIKAYRKLPPEQRDPLVETRMLVDDRRRQFEEEISPHLSEEDAIILMDRSKYTMYAYQGEHVPLGDLRQMNSFFPDADLALLMVCSPETSYERIEGRGEEKSYDESKISRLAALRSRFETVASEFPETVLVGCDGSERAVYRQVRSHVNGILGREMNRAVFVDKDGTIVDNSMYPEIPKKDLYSFSAEAIRKFKGAGYLVFVVSNQPWIERGRMNQEETEQVFLGLAAELASNGAEIDGYSYCPHDKKTGCACHKPGTLLLEDLVEKYNIDTRNTWVVGDSWREAEMGRRMGMKTALVLTGEGEKDFRKVPTDCTGKDILDVAYQIVGKD